MDLLWCFQLAAQSRGDPSSLDNTALDSFQIPVGTVLPIRVNHGFSTKNARSGQVVTGRIMQDAPWPGRGKIPSDRDDGIGYVAGKEQWCENLLPIRPI